MADSEKQTKEKSRAILHEGYLSKKGQIHRAWKKRYFVLFSDKKLAYYSSKEVTHLPPISEINLSTVKELSLLKFSNNPPKQRTKSRAKSFAEIFIKKDKDVSTPSNDSLNNHTLSSTNCDSSDEDVYGTAMDENERKSDIYVDAPYNTRSICNKRNAFDIRTEKRPYWLQTETVQQLNEWIIHLKYAIFGKLMLSGYLTKKTKKLKTKWKRRFIEVYESKIIRIYKNDQKTKVKEQIDIDQNSVSMIAYGDSTQDMHANMPFPIDIYDCNNNLSHIFSAESKKIRDEFMDAFYLTMNACKINVLCEGYLHFRAEDAKCWKKEYFALIEGALITFKDELLCNEFKNRIFSSDDFYNKAFHKYIRKSMPVIDPEIEKKSYHEIDNKYKYSATSELLESLKIFTVTTSVSKWYFGAEEATQLLFWCQSFHTFCKSPKSMRNGTMNALFSDGTTTKVQNRNFSEIEIEHSESKKAQSAEPRFVMDIGEDLMAINDGDEEESNSSSNEAIVNGKKKIVSGNILMAVNLDKRSRSLRDVNMGKKVGSKHFIHSQSLVLKPFTEQELQLGDDIEDGLFVISNNNDSREDLKNNEKDYVYSSDELSSDESEKDCLDFSTMHDNGAHRVRKRTNTVTHFIVDDDY